MCSFGDFPKIDAHIHFNSDQDTILEVAESHNFDLLTINTEVPAFPSIDKQQVLAQKYRHHSKVDLFYAATVSTKEIFRDDWAEKTIKKIKKDINNGASGVKFWKNIGMSIQKPDNSFLMLDDNKFKPVFSFLEKNQIPVLGHQGEPKNCWLPIEKMTVKGDKEYFAKHPEYHMYLHDEYPGYWQHINARDNILEEYPNLPFVGLHLASLEWNLDEVSKRLEKYPNLAVDLAERIVHLYYHAAENKDRVINFFRKYQNRIIYGTDIISNPTSNPDSVKRDLEHRWTTHWQFLATNNKLNSEEIDSSFQGLNLSSSILKKIYRKNAIEWYKL